MGPLAVGAGPLGPLNSHWMVAALSWVSHKVPLFSSYAVREPPVMQKSNSAQPRCLGMCASFSQEPKKEASNGSVSGVVVYL